METGTLKVGSNGSVLTSPACSYKNFTSSNLVKTGAGQAVGIIINSHSSGTLKLWNSTAAATTVLCETISFAVGERTIPLFGVSFDVGLYATVGGTANITLAYL